MQAADNFTAKLNMIRRRLDRIKHRQMEHCRQFKRLQRVNMNFKAFINVMNSISVTSLVLTFSGSDTTLIICAFSNSLSAIGTAILSVANMEDKSHSHQTSYLQFVELHDAYTAELLVDNLCGQDLDRILSDLNSKVGLILDTCEPIELPTVTSVTPNQSVRRSTEHVPPIYNFIAYPHGGSPKNSGDSRHSISLQQPFNLYQPTNNNQHMTSSYQQRYAGGATPTQIDIEQLQSVSTLDLAQRSIMVAMDEQEHK